MKKRTKFTLLSVLSSALLIPSIAGVAVSCAGTSSGNNPVAPSNAAIAESLAQALSQQQTTQGSVLNVQYDNNLKNLTPAQAIQKENQQFLINFVRSIISANASFYDSLSVGNATVKIDSNIVSLTAFNANSSNDGVVAKVSYSSTVGAIGTSTSLITFTGFKTPPSNNSVAMAVANALNTLPANDLDVANFAQTSIIQYMAPSYAVGRMNLQVQEFIRNIIQKNPSVFNQISVPGYAPISIQPNQISVSFMQANPIAQNISEDNNSLYVSINYNPNGQPSPGSNSSQVVLNGLNGFNPSQKAKIATWFNQASVQENLMKALLNTNYGHTFLANLLNQNFSGLVFKGLGSNFEIQNIVLNNDITISGSSEKYSTFVLTIKTTAAAQYSSNWSNGWQDFKTLPVDSIITLPLPLTFKLPSSTTNNTNVWQPNYILSSTYTNTDGANSSWVLMNGFSQFTPYVTWTLPPYGGGSSSSYPGAGNVGTIGWTSSGSWPTNWAYYISVAKSDGEILVQNIPLVFRFAELSTQTAYVGETFNSTSWIQMPSFIPTSTSAGNVFDNLFQELLKII